MTQAEADAIARQANQRPEFQQALQARGSIGAQPLALLHASQATGLNMPEDFRWKAGDAGWGAQHENAFQRHPWLAPALIGGGALTAGLAIPALMGGGAAAGGAAGSAAPSIAGSVPGIAGAGGGAAGAGMSMPSLATIGKVGQVASGIAAGRAGGRTEENRNNLLMLQAPEQNAHNSVQGDILAGVQPVNISGPLTGTHGKMPTISGGLNPSLLSANTRQLGGNMSRDALLAQMNGETHPQQGNALDSILSGVGYAGLIGGALDQLPNRRPPAVPDIFTPPFAGGARGR